jgi:hypothetical protein
MKILFNNRINDIGLMDRYLDTIVNTVMWRKLFEVNVAVLWHKKLGM